MKILKDFISHKERVSVNNNLKYDIYFSFGLFICMIIIGVLYGW